MRDKHDKLMSVLNIARNNIVYCIGFHQRSKIKILSQYNQSFVQTNCKSYIPRKNIVSEEIIQKSFYVGCLSCEGLAK